MRVSILGGGNGAHCMAADLALAGHRVRMFEAPELAEKLRVVSDRRAITLSGIGRTGVARLERVTFEIGEAIEDAELINIVTPAFAHERFFELLVPELSDGQTVVVWAGDFGSIELHNLLRQQRPELSLQIVEMNTLPYGTRLLEPGHVQLLLTAPILYAAALPARDSEEALEPIRALFGEVRSAPDVLGVALSNPNPLVHPAASLLNVGRIQYSRGDFYLYREGITEAVAKVIEAVCREAAAIAEGFGTSVLSYEARDYRTTGTIMGVAFQAPFDTFGVIASVRGPEDIWDRYITEDLPFGLVPMSELGSLVGVPAPLMKSLVSVGSAVCDQDFLASGRTLERLGLMGMGREDVLRLVREG